MGSANLALVFGPTLTRAPGNMDPRQLHNDVPAVNVLIQLCINFHRRIFRREEEEEDEKRDGEEAPPTPLSPVYNPTISPSNTMETVELYTNIPLHPTHHTFHILYWLTCLLLLCFIGGGWVHRFHPPWTRRRRRCASFHLLSPPPPPPPPPPPLLPPLSKTHPHLPVRTPGGTSSLANPGWSPRRPPLPRQP